MPPRRKAGAAPRVLQDYSALPLAIYLTLFWRRVNSLCSDARLYCHQPINQGISLLSDARGLAIKQLSRSMPDPAQDALPAQGGHIRAGQSLLHPGGGWKEVLGEPPPQNLEAGAGGVRLGRAPPCSVPEGWRSHSHPWGTGWAWGPCTSTAMHPKRTGGGVGVVLDPKGEQGRFLPVKGIAEHSLAEEEAGSQVCRQRRLPAEARVSVPAEPLAGRQGARPPGWHLASAESSSPASPIFLLDEERDGLSAETPLRGSWS